jgi:hypothetical protein
LLPVHCCGLLDFFLRAFASCFLAKLLYCTFEFVSFGQCFFP